MTNKRIKGIYAVQSNNRKEDICFTNFDRIDESKVFKYIYENLKANPNVVVGKKRIGPSEDFYECTICGENFTLFYDIDGLEGTTIYSESVYARNVLRAYFSADLERI